MRKVKMLATVADKYDSRNMFKEGCVYSFLEDRAANVVRLGYGEYVSDDESEVAEAKEEAPKAAQTVDEVLGDKTVSELKDMCRKFDLPEEEWKALRKAELVSYLKAHVE